MEIIKQYKFNNILTDYLISDKGKVFSIKRKSLKLLKSTKSSSGYRKVRLSINGKIYNRTIHRMVAETFIPNPKNKKEVNHKDGNKSNNNVSNLEWTTRKENAIHAYDHGLFGIGESFSASDISNSQCEKICKLLENTDYSTVKISKMVNCSKKIVRDILHKYTWKHISDKYDFSKRKIQKKINKETATEICKLLITNKYSSKEISEIIGCKIHIVKDIKRGKTWTELYNSLK